MVQCLSADAVNESFIANLPLISSTIKNMTIQAPNWFRDLYTPTPWPVGEGTIMEEFKFRGELPETEEGFDSWGLVDNVSGCDTGSLKPQNCSYNMHILGGHAFESKITRLMTKDFKTVDYCVKSIQNTRQYEQVFSAIISNLYNQIDYQKEVNVGQNFMSTITKKYVIDGAAINGNPADPYTYRAKGTATLAPLNIDILTLIYNTINRAPDMLPFAVNNGMKTFALVASPETINSMERDDPTIRADIRAIGGERAANLVDKYGFTKTFRDMFFPVPYLTPRRFRWDAGNARWIRILPFVKGVPGIVGSFAGVNPQYDDPAYATHEEVLIHGADPFSVMYQPTVQTIGEGTDFGGNGAPESGFWDVFKWINPQTRDDPERRDGFFFTTATIALSADNSESCMGFLVPRKQLGSMIRYYSPASCPPEAVDCGNTVPAVTECPLPVILSITPHPLTAGTYFVTFAAPVNADPTDVIQLGLTSGGFLNATVVENGASVDRKTFQVTIAGVVPTADRFDSVYVAGDALCSSTVVSYSIDASDNTRLDLVLEAPIKGDTASDAVVLFYGNGATQTATVVGTPNFLTNVWKVDIGASAFVDNVGGIVKLCTTPAADESCPTCGSSSVVINQCS